MIDDSISSTNALFAGICEKPKGVMQLIPYQSINSYTEMLEGEGALLRAIKAKAQLIKP
jgi:hypothetical protein